MNKLTLLICLSGVISYAVSAHSRKHEFEADKRSLRLSRNPQGLISGIVELERMQRERLQSTVFNYTQSKEFSEAVISGLEFVKKTFHSVIATHPTTAERQQAIKRVEIIDETDNTSMSDPNNIRQRPRQETKPHTMPSGISLYNDKKPGQGFTLFVPEKDVSSFNTTQSMLRKNS